MKVLSYGRWRSVIVKASQQDPTCVLANILTAHYYASSSNPSLSSAHLEAAKAHLVINFSLSLLCVYDVVIDNKLLFFIYCS